MDDVNGDPLGDLIRFEVRLADLVKIRYRAIVEFDDPADTDSGSFGHFNYKNPAYLLAHLYRLDHPANTLRGNPEALAMAVGLADRWVIEWHAARKRGERTSTSEWPVYGMAAILRFLDAHVDAHRRADWSEFVENYCLYAMERPFGMTAPNHEAWRCAALWLAGDVLARPEWKEAGLFFCERLIELQTAEGFWEEGRHHGPSLRYNGHMIFGLALLYRHSGAAFVRESGTRLADFMCATTFPDGTSIGAFDGRLPTAPGAPVYPGLEWTPAGRTLNARGLDLWRRTGRLDNPRQFQDSLWSICAGMLFYGATCHYFAEMLPPEERGDALRESAPLPAGVDADGTQTWHAAEFRALLHRRSPWTLALSSQNSDVPKDSPNVFRLERQSRIEIWHADAGVVLGGGHNLRDADIPFANAVLDTGFSGETAFGVMAPMSNSARCGYYMPRFAASGMEGERPFLRLVFAHGAVSFLFDLADAARLMISAEWDVRNVRRLMLQIPLIAWKQARIESDGNELPFAVPADARESVAAIGGPFRSEVRLRIPSGVPAKLYPRLPTHKYNIRADEEDASLFAVALVSCQWTEPANRGRAEFELSVTAGR